MYRSIYRWVLIAGAAFAVTCVLTPRASAQRHDKKTTMTINQPFQIPGVALPAGTYVVKLVDLAATRTVVRFMNADQDKVYATVLGIPDYKLKTPEKTEFSFYEAEPGVPRPLHAWFYPGDNYGVAFVYPKAKAVEIARESGEPVIAVPEAAAEPEPNPTELMQEPLVEIQPNGEELPLDGMQPEVAPAPAEVAPPAPAEIPEALPKTSTPFVLFGLAGLLGAGLATGVRVIRKRF